VIVAALGTSLTEVGGWLDPLGQLIAEQSRQSVSVRNFGKSGANSSWGITQVERLVATHPDVVLIEFSVNDASWLRGISLNQSRKNMEKIVAQIRNGHSSCTIYLMTMSPVLIWRRWMRPRLKAYYDLYGELAEELKVGYIDNRPSWNSLTRSQLAKAIPDGSHPNQDMAVRLIVPTIARVILDRRCPAGAQPPLPKQP
jgi:lysophospholipase L1-like esterase